MGRGRERPHLVLNVPQQGGALRGLGVWAAEVPVEDAETELVLSQDRGALGCVAWSRQEKEKRVGDS